MTSQHLTAGVGVALSFRGRRVLNLGNSCCGLQQNVPKSVAGDE